MTDDEISHRISRWLIYGALGNPYEYDYGKPGPREFGLSSAERSYIAQGRNHWSTPEERLAELAESKPTKEEYDLIEAIYRKRSTRDRMTIAYYGSAHPSKIPQSSLATMMLFRGDVSRL